MNTVATICARGGSVGVPRKNVRLVGGKPLIAHTIEQAISCPGIDDVFVSTDDEEIARIAREWGAKVPFLRPAELAGSAAPKIPVIEHLVSGIESQGVRVDRVVDLDPTSPLRAQEDILACLDLLDAETDVVITAYPADKNPYFNMVEMKTDGNVCLVCGAANAVTRRQAAPEVYSMNASIYVWHRHSLSKGLWGGRVALHVMPRERSVDIDSPVDLKLVELLMAEKEQQND